jgi:hypothetical protein
LAQEASFLSIASALARRSEHLSYSARINLSTKLAAVGRDDLVVSCLGDLNRQDAQGLRILCDATSRGRFLKNRDRDLEPYYYAASFGDQHAEISWFSKYGIDKLHGVELSTTIDRVVSYAEHDDDPFARLTLAEMLQDGRLASNKTDLVQMYLSIAALDGYLPAKLALLKHFPDAPKSDLSTAFPEFVNAGYFPGIAWCYQRLGSTGSLPPFVDSLLKAYYWHPDYPVETLEQCLAANSQIEELSTRDRGDIEALAFGRFLVADTIRQPRLQDMPRT